MKSYIYIYIFIYLLTGLGWRAVTFAYVRHMETIVSHCWESNTFIAWSKNSAFAKYRRSILRGCKIPISSLHFEKMTSDIDEQKGHVHFYAISGPSCAFINVSILFMFFFFFLFFFTCCKRIFFFSVLFFFFFFFFKQNKKEHDQRVWQSVMLLVRVYSCFRSCIHGFNPFVTAILQYSRC